jgi:hypothetical protein
MKSRSLMPCSQELATCPHHESDIATPNPSILFLDNKFWYYSYLHVGIASCPFPSDLPTSILYIFFIILTNHTLRPSPRPWFHRPKNFLWEENIVELVIRQVQTVQTAWTLKMGRCVTSQKSEELIIIIIIIIIITLSRLCRVVTLMYLKQTMFLEYRVSQLFRAYYASCIQSCLQY